MTRADGTACALLPVFPPGFPDGALPPRPDAPRLPVALYPSVPLVAYVHVFGAEHVRRWHGNVCTRTVCSCCAIREMKFKQYNGRPAVGSEIAYNNAFKIYSTNRCLDTIQPFPPPPPPPFSLLR